MKVLFLGPYRDGTGWGHAAIEYILALDEAGVEVVPRAIKLNDREVELPERILELEERSDADCNIVIQNILPHMFDYDGNFEKNIGLIFTEVSDFKNTTWANHCNTMDEIWVASRDSQQHVFNSDVVVPVAVAEVPCDPNKYSQHFDSFPIPEINEKFTFYFIGEYSRRKNLTALIKAFHLEFHPREDVALLLKTNAPGLSQAECTKHTVDHCNDIKMQLELYDRLDDYHHEIVTCDDMSDEKIIQIHQTCDCFVMPSFAEGWNIPAFDAMAMGKTPIVSKVGGMKEFMDNQVGWVINVQEQPVFGMKQWSSVPGLYTGRQTWWEIEIPHLRWAMRQAFENTEEKKKRAEAGIDRAYNFAHAHIGQHMKDLLDGKQKKYVKVSDRAAEIREKHDLTGMVKAST